MAYTVSMTLQTQNGQIHDSLKQASGVDTVAFSRIQGQIRDIAARLKDRGIVVAGADGVLMASADGRSEAEVAQLITDGEKIASDAGAKEVVAVGGDLMQGLMLAVTPSDMKDVSDGKLGGLAAGILNIFGMGPQEQGVSLIS